MKIGKMINHGPVNIIENAEGAVFNTFSSPDEKHPILFLSATPADKTPIFSKAEFEAVENAVRNSAYDLPRFIPNTTREDIPQALLDFRPVVVHFSGHGERQGTSTFAAGVTVFHGHGVLILEKDGQADVVPAELVADLLGHYRATLRCVVLNMCYGEAAASRIKLALPEATIVGTSSLLDNDQAVLFAGHFYAALAAGDGYDQAFDKAVAALSLVGRELAKLYHRK